MEEIFPLSFHFKNICEPCKCKKEKKEKKQTLKEKSKLTQSTDKRGNKMAGTNEMENRQNQKSSNLLL